MADPNGIERFSIAREAVARPRRLVVGAILGIGAMVIGLVCFLLSRAALALPESFVNATPALLLAAVVALLVYLNLPGSVVLGAEGLLVDRRGSKRYVPLGELVRADVLRESALGKVFVFVSLELTGGEEVKLPFGEDQLGAADRAEALCARVGTALEAYRGREQPPDASALSRGARSGAEWLARLRAIGSGAAAGPREAHVPAERLWRIVENPTAGAPARAAAAAALGPTLDAPGRARLRIAADVAVSPRLRVALEAAADNDDEALAAALAEVTPDP